MEGCRYPGGWARGSGMKVPRCASVRCVGLKVCPVYKSVPKRAHRCQGAEVCECPGIEVCSCVGKSAYGSRGVWERGAQVWVS